MRPSLTKPDILIATWFGSGYMRPAPGTWGSAAALPFAWVILTFSGALGGIPLGPLGPLGPVLLFLAALILFPIGVWASSGFDRVSKAHDSSEIVVDEVVGQWITLAIGAWFLAEPLSWPFYALGFLLFRLFDIVKPFPIGWLDKHIDGGFGVMADDVLAGIYAGIFLVLIGPYLNELVPF